MDRRDFIKNSCSACIGATTLSVLLSSCSTTKFIQGKMNSDGIIISPAEFVTRKKGNYLSYLIVRNEDLLFPICVYRFSEKEYKAIWMQCAHQGAELNVMGDYLQCPAHGSEYNNKGQVTHGPAESNLRTFPVIVTDTEIFIDLRKA